MVRVLVSRGGILLLRLVLRGVLLAATVRGGLGVWGLGILASGLVRLGLAELGASLEGNGGVGRGVGEAGPDEEDEVDNRQDPRKDTRQSGGAHMQKRVTCVPSARKQQNLPDEST